VTARVPHRNPRDEADAIANANYEALKDRVLRSVKVKLFGNGPRLNEIDLEEAYLLGWHGLCEYIIQGNKVENLPGFLVNATYLRAIDLLRETRADRRAEQDVDAHTTEDQVVETVDDSMKLQRLFSRMKDRLTDIEMQAVSLCVLHGLKRAEAAEILKVTERRVQKVMNSATKKIGSVVDTIDSRGCGGDEWARALRAYAMGVLTDTDPDYERVIAHIEDCETCRRYVMRLRGLAAILPPIGLPIFPAAGHEHSILVYLHHILGAGHRTTGMAQATVTATSASAGAAGSGGASVFAGVTAAKTAAVIAVAAVGAATAHVVASGHPPSHKSAPAASVTPSDLTAPHPYLEGQASYTDPKRSAKTPHHRRHVVKHRKRPPQATLASPSAAPPPLSASSPSSPSPSSSGEPESSGEFGFEGNK
jgi:DNA-directed RNA polymerase specialized sigma24 family protein